MFTAVVLSVIFLLMLALVVVAYVVRGLCVLYGRRDVIGARRAAYRIDRVADKAIAEMARIAAAQPRSLWSRREWNDADLWYDR
jgi:hypothetical protein